jgi:hypothetical protein
MSETHTTQRGNKDRSGNRSRRYGTGMLDPKNLKRTLKLFNSFSSEQNEKIAARLRAEYGETPDPVVVAKGLSLDMLAFEVREKIVADGILKRRQDPELKAVAIAKFGSTFSDMSDEDLLASIQGENVVEMLEQVVNGYEVIDDAATHQWLRDKLAAHYDSEIRIDNEADQVRAEASILNLTFALSQHDVLVALSSDHEHLHVFTNEKARAVIKDALGPLEPIPMFPDEWLAATLTCDDGRTLTDDNARDMAQKLANRAPSIRFGYLAGHYGNGFTVEATPAPANV